MVIFYVLYMTSGTGNLINQIISQVIVLHESLSYYFWRILNKTDCDAYFNWLQMQYMLHQCEVIIYFPSIPYWLRLQQMVFSIM